MRFKTSVLFRLFMMVTLLVTTTSCFKAGKKQSDAKAVFAVTGFVGGSWTGGAVIWAKGPNGVFKAMTLVDENDEITVDLMSGSWEFMAAGWLGSSPANGSIKCGKTLVTLAPGDNNVPISLTAGGCADAAFAPAAFINGGNLKPVRLIACHAVASPTAGSNCNATKGNIRSYKIVFSQMTEGGPIPDFKTACINDAGIPASVTNTAIQIPLGRFGTHPFHTTIVAFSDTGCGTFEKRYVFKDGLVNPSLNGDSAVVAEASFTEIYLEAPKAPSIVSYSAAPGNYVVGGAIATNNPTTAGAGPFQFTVTPALPLGLSLNVTTGQITGTPSSPTPSASYDITVSNSAGSSAPFSLIIEVLGPASLSITNNGYDFGLVPNGAAQTIVVTVSNGAGLATATAMSHSNSGYFIINVGGLTTCGTTLIGGASCDLELIYSPLAAGPHAGSVGLTYNNGATGTSALNSISGTGVAPALLTIVESDPYDFGSEVIGNFLDHTFTITNSGGFTATSIVKTGVMAGRFQYKGGTFPGTGGDCGPPLAPAGTCDIVVTFTPDINSLRSEIIEINYDDGTGVVAFNSGIQGTGLNPALLTIDSGPLHSYGNSLNGFTQEHTFTVNNTGDVPATTIFESGLAAPFQFKGGSYPGTGGNCSPTSINPLTPCTLVVEYSPTGIATHPDSIDLNYNNGAGAQVAIRNIVGYCVTPPALSIDDVVAREGTTATFTVSSPIAINQQMDFDYAASGGGAVFGTDYNLVASSGFMPGGSQTAIINVNVIDDVTVELADEIYNVNISNPVNATIGDGAGLGTIISDDETKKIFRSSGFANTTSLADGSGNPLSINGGIAKFTLGLPPNVGVGDMLEFDSDDNGTIDSVAMITKRNTSTRYVIRAIDGLSAPNNMTTNDFDWKIFRAYTSLANAETGTENTGISASVRNFDTWTAGKDLTVSSEEWNIACYADAVDTTGMMLNGWVTSAGRFINIFTPHLTNHVGVSQRHNGTFGAGFKMQRSDGTYVFNTIANDHVRFTGIQVVLEDPAEFSAALQMQSDGGAADAEVWFTDNIITMIGTTTGTAANNGIQINGGLTGTTKVKISNNVIYNSNKNGIHLLSGNHFVYNNTVSGSGLVGINASANSKLVNNISNANPTNFGGTPLGTSNYNASSGGGGGAPGANSIQGQTFSFFNSSTGNFSLIGGAGTNVGTDLSSDPDFPITHDIAGTLRSGPWEIGAFDF